MLFLSCEPQKAIQQAEKASADVGNAATGAGEGIAAYLMAGAYVSSTLT